MSMMSPMSRRSKLVVVIALASWVVGCGASGGSGGSSGGGAARSVSTLEALPLPARLAVEREVGDGDVKKVSAYEFEGRTVYRVRFLTADSQKGDLQVGGDGRVLRREVEVSEVKFETLPEAVRAAAAAHTGGVLPRTATRGMIGTHEVYAIEAELSGREHDFVFDSGGRLLESSQAIDAGQLPTVAKAALLHRFPGLKIDEVSEVRAGSLRYFEVEFEHDGRRIEATMLDDGTFRSVASR